MPRYICKLKDNKTNVDYYLEWSTIVDAPVTFGVDFEEFKEYYLQKYGVSSICDFRKRMEIVNTKGCSSPDYNNVEEIVSCNRAGFKEEDITLDQIVEWYCVKKKEPDTILRKGN